MSPDSAEYRALLPFVLLTLALVVVGLPLLTLLYLFRQLRSGRIARLKELSWEDDNDALMAYAQLSHTDALLLQLCAMFRPAFWWYSVFVLVRRLTSVILLLSVADARVWIWLSYLQATWLTLHVALQPYERRVDNALETVTLSALLTLTTLRNAWPPPYISPALMGLFLTILIAPLLPIAITTIIMHRRRSSERNARQSQQPFDWTSLRVQADD